MDSSKVHKDQIKQLLRADNIKLWEAPYTNEDGTGSIPQTLITSFSSQIGCDETTTRSILEKLRVSAWKRAVKRDSSSPSRSNSLPQIERQHSQSLEARSQTEIPSEETSTSNSNNGTLTRSSDDKKSKKFGMFKKKKKEDDMVSFENDAFFLAQESAHEFKPNRPDAEPAYFDDLSEQEQQKFVQQLELEKKKQNASDDVSTSKETDGDQGSEEDDDDDDDHDFVLADLNQALASNLQMTSAAQMDDSRQDTESPQSVQEGDEKPVKHHKHGRFKRFGGAIRNTFKKGHHQHKDSTDKLPPMAHPVAPVQSDFKANQMKMTDVQRVAVMTMVKQGKLSVDEAIEKVLAVEQLLNYQNEPSADEHSATAKNEPSTSDQTDQEDQEEVSPIRIADSERQAIMNRVKTGELTVDEAINLILDAEAELAKAQALLGHKQAIEHKPTPIDQIFSDQDLDFMGDTAKERLNHLVLNRPRQVGKRLPSRFEKKAQRRRSATMTTETAHSATSHRIRASTISVGRTDSVSSTSLTKVSLNESLEGATETEDGSSMKSQTSDVIESIEKDTLAVEHLPRRSSTLDEEDDFYPLDVPDWLEHIEMENYETAFTEAGITDVQQVPLLTFKQLQDAGIEDDTAIASILASAAQLERILKRESSKPMAVIESTESQRVSVDDIKQRPQSDIRRKKFHLPGFSRKHRESHNQHDTEEHHHEPEHPPMSSEFRARDIKLTNEQQIQVMMMVKEGKMNADQAVEKVLELEKKRAEKQASKAVTVDDEGFSVRPENAHRLSLGEDAFDKMFKKEQEDNSDSDASEDLNKDDTDNIKSEQLVSGPVALKISINTAGESTIDETPEKFDLNLAAPEPSRNRRRGKQGTKNKWSAFDEPKPISAAKSLHNLSPTRGSFELDPFSSHSVSKSYNDLSNLPDESDPFMTASSSEPKFEDIAGGPNNDPFSVTPVTTTAANDPFQPTDEVQENQVETETENGQNHQLSGSGVDLQNFEGQEHPSLNFAPEETKPVPKPRPRPRPKPRPRSNLSSASSVDESTSVIEPSLSESHIPEEQQLDNSLAQMEQDVVETKPQESQEKEEVETKPQESQEKEEVETKPQESQEETKPQESQEKEEVETKPQESHEKAPEPVSELPHASLVKTEEAAPSKSDIQNNPFAVESSESTWNPFGPSTQSKKPAKKKPPPPKPKPKKSSEIEPRPAQESSSQHSRIYQALNRKALFYDDEDEKSKPDKVVISDVGSGSLIRNATSLAATASKPYADPDREVQNMLKSAMDAERKIEELKHEQEEADDGTSSNRVSVTSIHFDEEFLAELDRRRQEREEAERKRAEELRLQFEKQQQEEQKKLEAELTEYQKQKAEEDARKQREKEQQFSEMMGRADEFKFDFKWS